MKQDVQEPGSDWYSLEGKNSDGQNSNQCYKIHEMSQHQGEIKNVDLHHSFVAVSKWGGPIAVTKDMQQINILKSEDVVKDCVGFFSNNGKLISKVSYKETERIALFEFLEDEQLLLLKADGKYYLMNPFKGTKKMYDLGESFRKDQIIKAQICVNGFVVMRQLGGQIDFQYIANAYEPQVIRMKSPEIQQIPENWVVIPPLQSQYHKVEVHITHPEAGIIMLVEDELKKIFYNKNFQENVVNQNLPHIPNIKIISMSPYYKFCSYLSYSPELAAQIKPKDQSQGTRNWVNTVVSNDFQLTVFSQIPLALDNDKSKQGPIKDSSITERPSKSVWCGDDCVVLVIGHHLLLVGPSGTERIRQSTKNFTVFPEIDGLRIITSKSNSILRRLPEAYVNVFVTLSVAPGAMLYAAYESFEKRNPIEDDDLRSKKDDLAMAVNDCLQSGQFEIQQEYQIKLLKAASYGKTFLGSQVIDPDKLSEVCKTLRVQNALKRNGGIGGRTLTYDQVTWLNSHQDLFVNLLLRYNLHYLAHEIAKYFNFSHKLIAQIYTHWACCKVETQENDDQLCFLIKEKIKEETGVSFTEIAHKAIEVGKSGLALKLLDNEPSLAKRVPVLLWMATYQEENSKNYYEKALDDALKSRDSNLIYLVIMKFLKSSKLDESYTFTIMSQNPITQSHLMNYLRSFDQQGLQRYLQYQKRFDDCAFLAIQQAYQQDKLPERIKLLEFAKKFFEEESKDSFYAKQLQDQIENLNDLTKNINNNKSKKNVKNPTEKPLNEILENFLKEDDLKIATEFQKFYKIPDRRFWLTRAKTLIQKKNFDELDRLVTEKNKKTVVLPYEILADIMIKQGDEEKGYQMILKMQDPEDQVNLFMKVGQMRYAAQAAMNAKKIQLLQDVRNVVQDPSLITYIDNWMSNNQKK